MKYILISICLLCTFIAQSQDLQCNVQVNSDKIQTSNKEIFIELQNAINQFINQRKWISDKVQPQEKINCNLVINITSFNIDKFEAEVSITSSRPVFGTTYNTPMFNHFDQEWYFSYAQFQSLEYQDNANIMPLTTLIAFYANVIIGVDFDSFHPEGGNPYFTKALEIRNIAQKTAGWNPSDGRGNRNKYYIIDQLMDDRYRPLRTAYYQYHMTGMDKFKDDNSAARKEIYQSLEKIRIIQERLPNSVIFKIFFNAKREELINIFKQAEPGLKNRAIELLGKLDPSNISNYEKIKQ
ncbi:MAG: hypothetical protein COA58_08770 [Bacteroidetes bacterium]|nr:MAG: hypothetical protein COA58_08770 [Bacteroidota bacterium]